MEYKAEEYEVHSIGKNRALIDYDDVVQNVVKFWSGTVQKERPVTLGMLMEKNYADSDIELNFVQRKRKRVEPPVEPPVQKHPKRQKRPKRPKRFEFHMLV
jgi:hypothetical protein